MEVKPKLRFPDRKACQRYVRTLNTEDELESARRMLMQGKSTTGIHHFYSMDIMGLVKWDLDQQAIRKGFRIICGAYREKPKP